MEKEEPLIPKLFKRWALSRKFSKEEREELRKIERDAYMEKARTYAMRKGVAEASERFEGGKQ